MTKNEWRYSKLRIMDISNGPGIRVSLFTQGCRHCCKGCFNPETWCLNDGKLWTSDVDKKILDILKKDHVDGLSILGGDPFLYYEDDINIENDKLLSLVKMVKENYPEKSIWLWTGYLWEDFFTDTGFANRVQSILPYIDIIVDGKFIEEEYDPKLIYCGSRNQRVIDVQKSLKSKEIFKLY